MSNTAPLISLHEASKWYGDVIGINQVNLQIGAGITGMLGPNGAGKSTLLKLITGQLAPSRGQVEVLGMNPWRNPEVFRQLGYCPDSEAMYDDLTGFAFVKLMGRLAGYSGSESKTRAETQLERVGMAAHSRRLIRGYSKGMRQRTKLAAALIHDPQIVVLDEPLNGLDPMGRIEMLDVFRALAREGKSVIVSSHILHEIENLTRRIVMLHRGRMLAEGAIEEVRALIDSQPLTLRIGSPEIRAVGRELAGLITVTSLQFDNESLDTGSDRKRLPQSVIVRSSRPDTVYEKLQDDVLAGRYAIDEISALDENLDAVFQYLVKET